MITSNYLLSASHTKAFGTYKKLVSVIRSLKTLQQNQAVLDHLENSPLCG